MQVNRRTQVSVLLQSYPEAREILSWYDIDLDEADLERDLGQLCASYGIDLGDLEAELEALQDDDDEDYEDYEDYGSYDSGDFEDND